mgnify:FL=1
MKKKVKLKPFVMPTIYGIVTISLAASLFFLGNSLLRERVPVTYITSSTLTEDVEPVISETKKIKRPYIEEDVKILQNFYDNTSDKKVQENSLIFYENTYLQNSGIDYGKDKEFDVYSIYDGTIVNIEENDILGNIIEIQHTNDLIASYQCLGNIKVKENDTVTVGEVIATSGTCNISKNLGNHLHLEISKEGKMINPESIYDKEINQLN